MTRKLIDEATIRLARQPRTWLRDPRAELGSDAGLVFVVCSADPDMDPVFDAVRCAAAACGLRAVRGTDYHGDLRITDKILTMVRDARLVVADLSHETPDVYFELGYARGLDKTVITILKKGTVAHFDVHDWPYLTYIDSRPLERELAERLRLEIGARDDFGWVGSSQRLRSRDRRGQSRLREPR